MNTDTTTDAEFAAALAALLRASENSLGSHLRQQEAWTLVNLLARDSAAIARVREFCGEVDAGPGDGKVWAAAVLELLDGE